MAVIFAVSLVRRAGRACPHGQAQGTAVALGLLPPGGAARAFVFRRARRSCQRQGSPSLRCAAFELSKPSMEQANQAPVPPEAQASTRSSSGCSPRSFDSALAQAIGAVVSVNMLSWDFVLALYAVLIAEGIRLLEGRA